MRPALASMQRRQLDGGSMNLLRLPRPQPQFFRSYIMAADKEVNVQVRARPRAFVRLPRPAHPPTHPLPRRSSCDAGP